MNPCITVGPGNVPCEGELRMRTADMTAEGLVELPVERDRTRLCHRFPS